MRLNKYALIAALIVLLAANVFAADKYKKFDRKSSTTDLLEIAVEDHYLEMLIYGADDSARFSFKNDEITRAGTEIIIDGRTVFNAEGMLLSGVIYPFELIEKTEVSFEGEATRVQFFQRDPKSELKIRSRKKNRISAYENVEISGTDFVRGSVVSFWSDIKIDGEVNEDVIAIFGNISIGSQAVVRGDIIAINGNVDIARGAVPYGRVQSTTGRTKQRFDRWRRWQRREKDFSPIIRFYYNRVDGVTPQLGVRFVDEDSLLPSAEIYSGYAFSSEQWRYYAGLEQSFWLEHPVTVGGAFYRRLETDDNWLMPRDDNTVFALLATEDYRDYYEAEGGYIFARFTPFRFIDFELGVLIEEYNWLKAHIDLWSMFGGSKEFRHNYYSVPSGVRPAEIAVLDESEMTSINFKMGFDDADEEERFDQSFWQVKAELEWLPDGWNDDFDFTRYFVRAARYQTFNDYSGMYFKAGYGGADGDLPIHRRFFLGGLETLLGYKHKEYTGREFWFGNAEYRLKFPKTDITGLILYNLGQITNESGDLGEAELKQSIGAGILFEESLRIDLARRLDRSESSFQFHVQLGFNF